MTYLPPSSANLYPSGLSVSGISGYLQLAKPPLDVSAEVDLTQEVVDSSGEVLMKAFVSSALGLLAIAAGTWAFSVYGHVDTVDGTSEIVVRVYKRDVSGTETELFNTTTGALTASAAKYTLNESESAHSLGAITDRLVVKFYAKTSSASTRTVHLFYMGATHQTRLSLPVGLPVVPGGDMLASLYDSDLDGVISGSTGTVAGGFDTSPRDNLALATSTVTIVDDSKHNGFPVLLKLATGNLAVFYKQATSHDYDADSVVLMRTSTDNGATWSAASTVATDDTYDVQVGGGVVLSTGRVVLALCLNSISPAEPMGDSTRIIYSDDNCASWSSPYTVDTDFSDWDHMTGGNIVELDDGTLRMVIFGADSGDSYQSAQIYASDDEGETWGDAVLIGDGETDGRKYQEPNLVLLQNGQLMVLLRSDQTTLADSRFYTSYSDDDGATWSAKTEVFAATGAPRIIQLSDGILMCIYRDVSDKQADYRISRDNGETWEDPVSFSTGASDLMAYASMAEYDPGVIGIAWSDQDSETNADIYFKRAYLVLETGQLQSNVPTGTPPLVVASTTVVTNLNADTLDGLHASDISAGATAYTGAKVYNSANITLANDTATALTFNSESWDTDNCHSTTSNTSRLTAKTAGKYQVTGLVWFAWNATGQRSLYVYKNGTVHGQVSENYNTASASTMLNITIEIELAVDDYVELYAYQNSGGNLDVRYLSERTPYFMMHKI